MNDIKDKNIEQSLAGGSLLPKGRVPVCFKWKLEDIYPDDSRWERLKSVKRRLPRSRPMGRSMGSKIMRMSVFRTKFR